MTASNPLLAVTGSQRPYIFDLPHLISLPKGFEFRFRYRHRWVEKGLVKALTADPSLFVGREIVILYHSQEHKRVIPIRRGTILGLESLGPMVFVRFRVGEFVKVDLDVAEYSHPEPGKTDPAAEKLSLQAREMLGQVGGNKAFDLSK